MVAVFDTAFHQTMPKENYLYPVPYEWYEKYGCMRMGYHGASHGYIARKLKDRRRVISCHLGGSASICAILDGKSVDNSFSAIPGGRLHPQSAAPGYLMYTCWMIRHLPGNPWLQTDRCEDDAYVWLHDAKIVNQPW